MLAALSAFSGLSVDNIEKAKEFYVDTLALKLRDDTMGLQLELPGGGQLFIYQKDDHTPATFTVLNFVVEDINATVDHLVEHGINFERYDNMPGSQDEKGILRGKAAQQGPDIAWFKDPAGNILAILEE
jgi:predicted enzyme related to lactoylglutathione lyase